MRDRNSSRVSLTLVVCLDDVNRSNSAAITLPRALAPTLWLSVDEPRFSFFDFLISRPAGFPFQLEYELLAEC
jgi:hypothetical protein